MSLVYAAKTNILYKVHKTTGSSIKDIAEFNKIVYKDNLNVSVNSLLYISSLCCQNIE